MQALLELPKAGMGTILDPEYLRTYHSLYFYTYIHVYIYIHICIYIHTHTHKSTSTGNRMFQRLQKLVPLKHLSSEHMIYAHRN